MPIVFNVKIAICLIFAVATLACHFISGRCHRCTLPVQGVHACMKVGGGGFELRKQSVNQNETKFDYRLTTG